MSPQQKAQIAAQLERVKAERAVNAQPVNAQPKKKMWAGLDLSSVHAERVLTSSVNGVRPKTDSEEGQTPPYANVGTRGGSRKDGPSSDRHKPGYMTEYMRKHRAKK